MVPGERSGELHLLQPGEDPVTIAAPPKIAPMSSMPKPEGHLDFDRQTSPFLASSMAPTGLLPSSTGSTNVCESAFTHTPIPYHCLALSSLSLCLQ